MNATAHRTLLIHPLNFFGVTVGRLRRCVSPGRFRREYQRCTRERVPEGSRFGQCDYGYRAVDEACVAVKVPENGYLAAASAQGSGWQCDRAGIERSMRLAWL